MTIAPMNRLAPFLLIAVLAWCGVPAHAIDYTQLSAVKRRLLGRKLARAKSEEAIADA